jgi:hypothetical protein
MGPRKGLHSLGEHERETVSQPPSKSGHTPTTPPCGRYEGAAQRSGIRAGGHCCPLVEHLRLENGGRE